MRMVQFGTKSCFCPPNFHFLVVSGVRNGEAFGDDAASVGRRRKHISIKFREHVRNMASDVIHQMLTSRIALTGMYSPHMGKSKLYFLTFSLYICKPFPVAVGIFFNFASHVYSHSFCFVSIYSGISPLMLRSCVFLLSEGRPTEAPSHSLL